jgi:hypothetical protein
MAPGPRVPDPRPRETRNASPVAAVRDYAGGVFIGDLPRLWRQDWRRAYAILAGEPEGETAAKPPRSRVRSFLHLTWRLFLRLSAKLSPPRRLLFVLCLLFTLLGLDSQSVDIAGRRLVLSSNPLWLLLAILGLIVLLIFELADRVVIRDELEVARTLQHQLLPQQAPSLPGYEMAFSYRSANTVGGDYYNVLPLADGRIVLVSADASGHGIAAAMLMAIANATLKLAVDTDPSPLAVAAMMNRAILSTGGPRAFLTLFYGLLTPATGDLELVCAGHPYPLLRRADGSLERLGTGALPLGLRADCRLTLGTARLSANDLLVLYTDGFPEALGGEPEQAFGFERLERSVQAGGTPGQIRDRLLAEMSAFEGDRSPADDRSMVVLRRFA